MKAFQLFRKALPPIQRELTTNTRSTPTRPSPILNHIARTARRRPLSTPFRPRRNYSGKSNKAYDPTPNLQSPQPSLSLSQRLRKLSREYGWSAFGVYMLLSALDFPFCFAAVRYIGTDRIGHYEHVIVEWVKSVVPEAVAARYREMGGRIRGAAEENSERGAVTVGGMAGEETKVEAYGVVKGDSEVGVVPGYDHGVKEAEIMNESENASIWTQLALAYAIHKTFIFIRVPLTVAVTPKVVKVLRGWGWDIGKRRPKGSKGV